MASVQSILTISRDQVLQHTRTLILERAGYAVSAAHSDQEALAFLDVSDGYALVLICHSVPEPSRMFLVNAMKAKFPIMPVLMLYNGYDPTGALVDGSLHCLDTSPASLVTMIGFLTKGASAQRPVTPESGLDLRASKTTKPICQAQRHGRTRKWSSLTL